MGGVLRPIVLAAGLVLALAAPAMATPNWSASVSLSTPGVVVGQAPSVAIADGGLGVEAWSEPAGGTGVIRAAQHTPGGAWSAFPGNLSSSLPGFACTPFASIDPAGNALVVWTQWSGTSCFDGMQTLLFATHAAGASGWSLPGVVGASANPGSPITTAAVNAAGQMVVAWGTSDASYTYIYASVGSPTGGFGGSPNLIKAPLADGLYYLTAGIGPGGDAAVQWEHYAAGATGDIQISVRPRGGAFPATPVSLTNNTAPAGAYNGSVALDAAGDVLSAYTANTGTVTSDVTQLLRAGNTAPQPPQDTGLPGTDWIAVGLDSAGNATAIALQENYTPNPHLGSVSVATRAAGAGTPWVGQGGTAVEPGPYNPPRLLVNASGAALVAWQIATNQNTVQAFYRPAGGGFGPFATVGNGADESIALAPSGDAAVSFVGADADARVGVLDTTPPTLAAIAVPASSTPGAVVAMSAPFADAWTGLDADQPSWSFGDGTSGTGPSVSHTYGAAGTYTVTVTAHDLAGNTSAPITRQIVVSSPSSPPPPALPTVSLARPKVKAVWKASKLVGTVSVSGTVAANATLAASIRRHGAKKAAASATFKVKAGAWSHTLKLPASLAPGTYDVTVTGQGLKSALTSFTLTAPKSGIVKRSYASGPRTGPAVTTLSATSQLWAHFTFGTLPAKSQTITTQWILPNGSKLAANTRPRTSLVEAQVKDLSGKALPTGRWHCVIRAGGVVVATATVRLK